MLGLWVLELFAMYATDRQTDEQTDRRTKATLIAPFPTVEGIIKMGHFWTTNTCSSSSSSNTVVVLVVVSVNKKEFKFQLAHNRPGMLRTSVEVFSPDFRDMQSEGGYSTTVNFTKK